MSVLDYLRKTIGGNSGRVEQERLDRALFVLKEMLVAGVQPDSYTYSMLIFACSMVRNEDKAVEVLP